MRKGFTLVELAIVLVIIGLLIGGILTAQSMIETSRIQATVRQIQQIDVAVSNFRTKYNSLPGDSDIFSPAGNNTGIISSSAGELAADPFFDTEIANFWVHLQQSGFQYQNKTFTATIPGSGFDVASQTPNAPSIPLNKKAGIIVSYFTRADGSRTNRYSILKFAAPDSGTILTSSSDVVITTAQALAIDKKMDDGDPGAGKVDQYFLTGDSVDGYFGYGCFDGSGTKYNTATTGNACILSIDILSQTGGSQ